MTSVASLDPISRTGSPDPTVPLYLVRLASSDAHRDRIYFERAEYYRGKLGTTEYMRKTRLLDSCPSNAKRKSVWSLVEANSLEDIRASLEVYTREIYYRPTPESKTVVAQAAYLASIFVPPRWRGHGYARQLLRRVITSLKVNLCPAPLTDKVKVVYGSSDPGMESIYNGTQWHRFALAEWTPEMPIKFNALGPLPLTEPVYQKDLPGLLAVAAQRVKRKVIESNSLKPVFAVIPDEDAVKLRQGNYRANSKFLKPGVDQPVVIAFYAFVRWGHHIGREALIIFTIESISDLASLALCAAATDSARHLGCQVVNYRSAEPGSLAQALPFDWQPSKRNYSEGTMMIDCESDATECEWINMARAAANSAI